MFTSNSKYYIKSTISSSQSAGTTFLLSKDFELDEDLETGSDTVSLVLKSSNQIERFEISATGGVATIVKRGITQSGTSDTVIVGLQKQWTDGTIAYVTALAFDLVDKQDVRPDRISIPTVADTTARDALYPAPTGGEEVRVTSLGGAKQGYNSVTMQWETEGTSTAVPIASTTAAGITQISTQGAFDAGTDAGSTGAKNVVTPALALKQINTATGKNPLAEADKFGISDSADYGKLKSIALSDLRAQIVNFSARVASRLTSDASAAITYAHGLGRIPKSVIFNATTSATDDRTSNGFWDGTNNVCTYSQGATGGLNESSHCIYFKSGTDICSGYVSASDASTFTITWTKTGSPVAILYFNFLAIG